MGSIDWGDVLRGSLAFFLILAGVGILFVCIKLGALLGRLGRTVGSMTDEIVPILTRAQGTVDGINLELARVDEIMVTAVNATKGAEKTVTTLSSAAVAPVKKASGLAAAAREALATVRARRAAGPDEAEVRAQEQAAEAARAAEEAAAEIRRTQARDAFVAEAEALRQATASQASPTVSVTPPAPPAPPEPVGVAAAPAPPAPAPAHPSNPYPVPEHRPSDGHVPDTARRGLAPSMIEWALPKKDARR